MILSRMVKLQLVAFLLISTVGIAYVGLNYVGVRLVSRPYVVTAHFADGGGIFTNAMVAVRGVEVGKVSGLHLTPDGVDVELSINPGVKIPADSRAQVSDLSAVGEQYVDLVPQDHSPPYLRAGSSIPRSRTSVPLSDATILADLYQLTASVNTANLSTLIRELGAAFNDLGPSLQRLIDKGNQLTQAATDALPQSVDLIEQSRTALDTQRATSGDLQTFARNLASFSHQLVTDDPAIRAVFDNGVTSAQQLSALLQDNRTALPLLFANLATLNEIQAVRLPGLKVILTLYPPSVANGFLASPGDGTGHFGLQTDSSTPVCRNGYLPESAWRDNSQSPQAYPENFGGKANLNTYCLEPHNSNIDVRGARNAPRPAGDTTATPPAGQQPPTGGAAATGATATAPAAAAPTGAAAAAPYDPISRLVTLPGGQTFELGSTGGQQAVLGPASWSWLLLAPALAS